MIKTQPLKNKIAIPVGLALILAVAGSFSLAGAQTAPQTKLFLQYQARNVTFGQTEFDFGIGGKPGDQLEFRVQLSNAGGNVATNARVQISLPAGITRVSGTDLTNFGNLAVGANSFSTFLARIGTADNFPTGQNVYASTASATADNIIQSTLPLINSVAIQVTRDANPLIAVAMEGRNVTQGTAFGKLIPARLGDKLEFRTAISNTGDTAVNLKAINKILPINLKFVPGTLKVAGMDTFFGDLFNSHLLLGDLAKNQTRVITYEVIIIPSIDTGSMITNTVTLTMDNGSVRADGAQVSIQGAMSGGSVAGTSINIVLSHKAFNQTQNRNATEVTAQPNDLIVYTLTAQNTGNGTAQAYVVWDDLSDVLQLSNLVDFNGAEFFLGTLKLKWQPADILASSKMEKRFSIKVRNTSATDRVMTNNFGNITNINVAAVAGTSVVASTQFVAPRTGPSSILSLILAALTVGSGVIFGQRRLKKAKKA
ncbi:MAG: hypothetical protein A3H72_03485 [Candidatus Doudnabacteria bacterium RIFCSPLOWO2_02_FULL_48_8]|uniref:Uncharacterized protein n=1 Tax=Candidatus Doudnabacteria bacterium RIFCSPHIGHO2_01_FULL_46_24 TaxID=1817825 RepID=A0A1F5NU62_9BACT|nr:MAG: hypothetical protein A2720_01560 [Candidatus Doudnabacteria bacterium RIFCSPHIGHO2_01_FULL_46_24]OGE94940.1 MAG: hypothetical protein A3H72_03485 [Candidatus Doudnabacteria bacterium RIFCSPLOWO2_02_FULL_48_8]OGE95678.1 MAG: hypothetical protein A3E98_02020 [Candidatus Doudnabacteria bacterium RIFCSPHIGHO2_12_FULL_48_11]